MAAEPDKEAASDAVSEVLKNLEAEITCGICYEHYRDPKLLPCGHYFCKRCVRRLAQHANGKPFPCPMCSEPTTLPRQGVDELPAAFFVASMLATFAAFDSRKEELRAGRRKLTCDICKKEGVVNYCRECDHFLCGSCSESHRSMSATSRHHLMSLEELERKRERGSFMSRNTSLFRTDSTVSYPGERGRLTSTSSIDGRGRDSKCPKHDDAIRLYCYTHDVLICRDCTVYDHPRLECKTGFIREEAPKTRRVLTDALTPLHKAHESIAAVDKEVDEIQTQVEAQEAGLVQAVKETFEHVRSRVDHCEEILMEGIYKVSQGKKDVLSGQRKALQIATSEVETSVETVKQDVANLTDEELMSTHKQLEMQIEKELARHGHRSLQPATNADTIVKPPSLDVIPTPWGLVYPKMDLLHLRIAPPTLAFVGAKTDYKIHIPYSFGEEIDIKVKSEVDPTCVIHAQIKPWREKEVILRGVIVARYDVTFTPRIRGRHKLTTKINGEEAPGSPFEVFVQIHPSHLGYVIRQSDEAGKPFGIAFTSEGTLVTAGNKSKDLKFWTRDLKEIPDASFRSNKFHYPRGVATAPGGVIYTSDRGVEKARDYTIMKFVNGHLQKGTVFGSRNVLMIKIIKGRLYAADERNSQVHIFSLDLDHIYTFNTKASNTHDIAEFNNHLYVLGNTQIAVYTFDQEPRFVGHVPTKGPVAPSSMRSICFDRGGHMFITQLGTGVEGVYVFKPTGDFITSFGHNIEQPLGIVIDEDGFVYVVDHIAKNSRIYIF